MHQLALRVLLASRFPNQVDDQHGPPRALGRKVGGALPQDPPFHLFDSSYNWPVITLKRCPFFVTSKFRPVNVVAFWKQ